MASIGWLILVDGLHVDLRPLNVHREQTVIFDVVQHFVSEQNMNGARPIDVDGQLGGKSVQLGARAACELRVSV